MTTKVLFWGVGGLAAVSLGTLQLIIFATPLVDTLFLLSSSICLEQK